MAEHWVRNGRYALASLSVAVGSCLAITLSTAYGQAQSKPYENREHRFAITPPSGWNREVSREPTRFVVKFINERGTLSALLGVFMLTNSVLSARLCTRCYSRLRPSGAIHFTKSR